MSDKARELAQAIFKRWFDYWSDQMLDEAATLIDVALQSARLKAIEECRKECYILNLSAHKGEMGYKFATRYHEAKLKEAPDADAE